nr:hypothetical protein [uncultured Flavobacterium sp.]
MENYDLKGVIVEGNKAVIAVVLPELIDNKYEIHQIHNISDQEGNKIVIHFRDLKGKPLCSNSNFELFKIDLNSVVKNDAVEIDFTKEIKVAFHHENDVFTRNFKEIFIDAYKPRNNHNLIKEIEIPDTTGRGTIRESV